MAANNSLTASRKRKPKDPCNVCYLNQNLCICKVIPTLDLRTKISLIIHAKELKRTTNTGRLALEALPNSEMRIRGLGREALDLSDLLSPQYDTLLFFPCDDAVELTSSFIQQFAKPIQLIVPDGNWRQASKVHTRHPELKDIPRVMISTPNTEQFHLRAESTSEGMATLQAIAYAMGAIEGPEVQAKLLDLYNAKLQATLIGRGVVGRGVLRDILQS